MKIEKIKKLSKVLEEAHREFLDSNEVSYDALAPALKYSRSQDREMAAFICSILAYGRIVQIKKSIFSLLDSMGESPVDFLIKKKPHEIRKAIGNWKHRFNTSFDAFVMLMILKKVYTRYSSLEKFIDPTECISALELNFKIHNKIKKLALPYKPEKSFYFFIPDPNLKGALKRMNLFLKWMVRDEEPDLGLWKSFSKEKLIIPLDTHIYKQALSLGFTKRKAADFQTAQEITEALKKLSPQDPTKYDFALCHLGVRGKILSLN